MAKKNTPTKPKFEPQYPNRYSHSTFDPEAFEAICQWIEDGEGIRKACIKSKTGISPSTFHTWAKAEASRYERYARAQDICWRVLADQFWDIVDDGSNDYYTEIQGTGENERAVQVFDKAKFHRDRLRADSLKWLLAKKLPNEYGDKIEVNGSMNMQHTVVQAVPEQGGK